MTEKVESWEDLDKISEGELGFKVTDEKDNLKTEVRHTRIKGDGSKEFERKKVSNVQGLDAEKSKNDFVWVKRDIPRGKEKNKGKNDNRGNQK